MIIGKVSKYLLSPKKLVSRSKKANDILITWIITTHNSKPPREINNANELTQHDLNAIHHQGPFYHHHTPGQIRPSPHLLPPRETDLHPRYVRNCPAAYLHANSLPCHYVLGVTHSLHPALGLRLTPMELSHTTWLLDLPLQLYLDIVAANPKK